MCKSFTRASFFEYLSFNSCFSITFESGPKRALRWLCMMFLFTSSSFGLTSIWCLLNNYINIQIIKIAFNITCLSYIHGVRIRTLFKCVKILLILLNYINYGYALICCRLTWTQLSTNAKVKISYKEKFDWPISPEWSIKE